MELGTHQSPDIPARFTLRVRVRLSARPAEGYAPESCDQVVSELFDSDGKMLLETDSMDEIDGESALGRDGGVGEALSPSGRP